MLGKLSLRGARRQFREYSLYFVTLACSISFLYAFNALLFSESVKALSELEILPFMIVSASLLVLFVLGFVVNYMTGYMLKRRSREFGIYMLSGISNRTVGRLVSRENLLIGLAACLLGIPAGILLSQLLEAALLNIFAQKYSLNFALSLPTLFLTILYFAAILLLALRKNGKWIRRIKLYDLLYFDRQNENRLFRAKASAPVTFLLSLLSGIAGILFLNGQPLGKGYDILIGLVLITLFLLGFFLSIPSFLVTALEQRTGWKYKKNHLLLFRSFTSKVQSMSLAMGILSVLFTLSVTFFGIGISSGIIAKQSISLNAFDVMILHNGERMDLSGYDEIVSSKSPVLSSHSYCIYTGTSQDFLKVRTKKMADSGRKQIIQYQEYLHDTYMKQSDYAYLRKMMGYKDVTLNKNSYYIHCVPFLEDSFRSCLSQKSSMEFDGQTLLPGDVFSEPFMQMDAYGNGFHYIIILPDSIAEEKEVLYSLYAADTEAELNSSLLQDIIHSRDNLVLLDRTVVRSFGQDDEDRPSATSAADPGKPVPTGTSLTGSGVDYLSGKCVKQQSMSQLYSLLICLFYLALILEITGAAVLATQVLSDKDKKRHQDTLLRQLGMSDKQIVHQNTRQLSLLFFSPVLPSLLTGIFLVAAGSRKMQSGAYELPLFTDNLWLFQSLGISLAVFGLLYCIYYAAARMSY